MPPREAIICIRTACALALRVRLPVVCESVAMLRVRLCVVCEHEAMVFGEVYGWWDMAS